MDAGILFIGVFVLAGVLVLVGVGVVFLVIMFRKKGSNQTPVNNYQETAGSPEEKKEILEMLARKDISKEEAEKKLQELGGPIPEPQPEQALSKNNKGCLIALIIGLVVLPLLLVILFVLGFVTMTLG